VISASLCPYIFLFVCLSVYLSVCLSVRSQRLSLKLHAQMSTNFCMALHVTCGRGAMLLWQQCDTLCTSGLWMTSFFYKLSEWAKSETTRMFRIEFVTWRHQSDVKQRYDGMFGRDRQVWQHRGRSLPSATLSCCLCKQVFSDYRLCDHLAFGWGRCTLAVSTVRRQRFYFDGRIYGRRFTFPGRLVQNDSRTRWP